MILWNLEGKYVIFKIFSGIHEIHPLINILDFFGGWGSFSVTLFLSFIYGQWQGCFQSCQKEFYYIIDGLICNWAI